MSLNVELLQSSFQLVVDLEPKLTLRFYDTLFARYPQVETLFSRDRKSQSKMLTEALGAVVEHLEDAPWLAATLGQMGKEHVGYGVKEEMYPLVAECLLATLSDVAEDAWTPELESAWSDALGAVAGLMIAGAQSEN